MAQDERFDEDVTHLIQGPIRRSLDLFHFQTAFDRVIHAYGWQKG